MFKVMRSVNKGKSNKNNISNPPNKEPPLNQTEVPEPNPILAPSGFKMLEVIQSEIINYPIPPNVIPAEERKDMQPPETNFYPQPPDTMFNATSNNINPIPPKMESPYFQPCPNNEMPGPYMPPPAPAQVMPVPIQPDPNPDLTYPIQPNVPASYMPPPQYPLPVNDNITPPRVTPGIAYDSPPVENNDFFALPKAPTPPNFKNTSTSGMQGKAVINDRSGILIIFIIFL